VIVLGALVVAVALSPWADSAADASLRAHMLQHLALMLVAAPLLVLGIPRRGALRSLPRALARTALALGHPAVGATAFAAAELGTHFTPLYELAARNTAVHVAEHALLLGGGLLFWWAVLGPATSLASRVLLLLFERFRRRAPQPDDYLGDGDERIARLSWRQAIGVGSAQAIALIPGISRSGITMGGGLLFGLSNEDAARYSFLLATPIIGAAAALKLPELLGPEGNGVRGPALVGAVCAGISTYLAVRFLLRFFETNRLTPFGIYCLGAGVTLTLIFALGG